MKSDSAAGPDGIPVVLLKKCAAELRQPLHLLWSESFQTGIVPSFYKSAYVSSLYKKGQGHWTITVYDDATRLPTGARVPLHHQTRLGKLLSV